jgi:hypothetical protein
MPTPTTPNNGGVGPRIGLGYPFDSTLGYPGEGPSRYPHMRRGERPSLRLWSTRGRPMPSSDAVSTRLVFDDVPPLKKAAHGNSDTRLGQWLQASRRQGTTDIATPRQKRVPDPEAVDGWIASTQPAGRLHNIAASARQAKKPHKTAMTVTSPHQMTVPLTVDPFSAPRVQEDTVAPSPLTRWNFIFKFAAGHGVNCAALFDIWQPNKHGYNKAYDAPFARFQAFFRETHPAEMFAPAHIRPGDLVSFLQRERESGASFASLKDASASVPMACREATDGNITLGDKDSVKRFLKAVRIHEPAGRRKKLAPSYHDVLALFQEAWEFGPNDNLCEGHLKEKLIILLMVDTAAMSKLHTETVPAQHNTRHKANVRQADGR